jgi:hypothetical protein
MRVVRRRGRTRHRPSRALAREKVMRATPENRHRDEHAPSWVPWRLSLHASRALSARPGPAPRRATRRGEAERAAGCDFHGFQIGHDSQHCSQQALLDSALPRCRWRALTFLTLGAPSSCQFTWRPPADRSPRAGPSVPIEHGADARRVQLRGHGTPPPASPPRHRADFVVCSRTAIPAI